MRRACAERAPKAYEYLLIARDERILEGSSSIFYGIRGRTLITAEDGVLEGITRAILYELASAMDFELDRRGLRLDELASLDEALLTSSTREVVPVTQVGGTIIADGKPGPITSQLATAYRRHAMDHAEPA